MPGLRLDGSRTFFSYLLEKFIELNEPSETKTLTGARVLQRGAPHWLTVSFDLPQPQQISSIAVRLGAGSFRRQWHSPEWAGIIIVPV